VDFATLEKKIKNLTFKEKMTNQKMKVFDSLINDEQMHTSKCRQTMSAAWTISQLGLDQRQ